MSTKIYISLIFIIFISCKKEIQKEQLIGRWATCLEEKKEKGEIIVTYSLYNPFGIGFTKNKIEFFNGIGKYNKETRKFEYKGAFTNYQIKSDSVFFKDFYEDKWKFYRKVTVISKDTLRFSKNDSISTKFYRIKTAQNDFDQIIFSRSGCFGTCPIMDISIDKTNKVYYRDEYTKPIRFHSSFIDQAKTNYTLNKYNIIDINQLKSNYSANHTDDETLTTTFIKDEKIVKTVSDYGKVAPQELYWTYTIQYLPSEIKFDSATSKLPKINLQGFIKDSKILNLKKSEGFYLWLLLNKAEITTKKIVPKYDVKTYYKGKTLKIISDGRFFEFSFKGKKTITYDLGYDFVQRNFKNTDFK